ncbi:MoaD/ThiS family protein [Flexivirga sp. ID2601S]|uniref:MoaD/ThiS family protein n=1 Tax=Flexivirga aerilata TaxID=1656889 RepID=A0A849AM14_9MICO|nr:MoaD/ThiS family protein [Flexivirga aerilata]NNG37852.1 MoaD/ThiS family protein [Flexivirga aerilata]
MQQVTVRYWAGAQAAAGVHEETLDAANTDELRAAAVAAHPKLAPVFAVASLLVDGRRVEPGAAFAAGSTVEVLPPFAGG